MWSALLTCMRPPLSQAQNDAGPLAASFGVMGVACHQDSIRDAGPQLRFSVPGDRYRGRLCPVLSCLQPAPSQDEAVPRAAGGVPQSGAKCKSQRCSIR